MPDTDAGDLVKAALGGDRSSWGEFVRRYSGLVWSVTRGYRLGQADAADVFQTTWLRLAEHLGRIDKPSQVDDYSPERAVLDAEQARLNSDRAARLWRAFGELSARCRELLRILIASPPPSYAEVAAAMDMPVGSIGPTRARCLRRLRERLAGEVSDAGTVAHESEPVRRESDRAR